MAGAAALTLTDAVEAQVPPATGPGLAAFGPINPADGFPIYYQDRLGLRLRLCQSPGVCLWALPNPAAPMVFPTNYSPENFYYHVGATGTGNGTASILYEQSLEATFVNGLPAAGEQIVFSRLRLRVTGLVDGRVYTVTHPYGTANYTAGVDARLPGEINITLDVGAAAAGAFDLALNGSVGPFLTPLGYVPGLPGSFISDSVTLTQVQGSPFGTNFLRIDGTGIGAIYPGLAANANRVQINTFTLMGQLATAGGVGASSAYYAKQAAPAETAVDVWGVADSGASLTASAGGSLPVAMKEIGTTGKFFGRVILPAGAVAPTSVTVTNTTDVPPISSTLNAITDLVSVQSALYINGNNLYVTASSSDKIGNPILTVTGAGLPTTTLTSTGAGVASGTILMPAGAVPPESITVTSAAGGKVTAPINVESPVPVFANAGLDQSVAAGVAVSLSGAASTGPIATYAWSQVSGPAVTLTGANTANATFTAPNLLTASVITLQLTVNGSFSQTSSDLVVVNVAAVPPVVANAGAAQIVAAGASVAVSGTASTGPIATYAWTQTAGPVVTLTGANTANATFTAPNLLTASVITLQLTVNGAFGQTSSATVNVDVAAVLPVVANAGLDQNVAAGAVVSLSAVASTGPVTSYAWSLSDPTIVLTGANTASASFTAPSLPLASSVVATLVVNGAFGQTSTDFAIITVNPAANPTVLVANAGLDQNVAAGAAVTVSGAVSSGPNPIVSYAWTQVAGPVVVLTGGSTVSASFVAPSDVVASSITLQLTVTDSLAGTASDLVVINVAAVPPPPPPAPVANAGLDQNVAAGARVTLSAAASTNATAFSWAQTGGPVVTLTGAATATVSFTAPSAATASVITMTLTARNAAGQTSTDIVLVNVAAVVVNDVVAMTQAQYIVSKNQWQVQGTASLRQGQTITVYLGATGNTTRLIGRATVAPDGRWLIQTPQGSGPAPAAADTTVWAQSSLPSTPVSRAFTRG